MTRQMTIAVLITIMLIVASHTACAPTIPTSTTTPLMTTTHDVTPAPTASPTPEPSPTPVKKVFEYNPYYVPEYGKDFLGESFEDYIHIMEALYSGETEVALTAIQSEKEFEPLRRALVAFFVPNNLLYDFMYLEGKGPYSFDTKTKVLTIKYVCEKDEYHEKLQSFTKKIESIFNEYVTDVDNHFETAKELHKYVANTVIYENDHRLTVYDAIMSDKGYCQTYSGMYQHLLWQAGIEAYIISNSTHQWNVVKLDDQFYHMDTTWEEGENDLYYFGMSDQKCFGETGHNNDVRFGDVLLDGKMDITCSSTRYDTYWQSESTATTEE